MLMFLKKGVIAYPTFMGVSIPAVNCLELLKITDQTALPKGCMCEMCPSCSVELNLKSGSSSRQCPGFETRAGHFSPQL